MPEIREWRNRMNEAADEIERLRHQMAREILNLEGVLRHKEAEIERLRSKVIALEHASGLTALGQERGKDKGMVQQSLDKFLQKYD